MGTNYYLIDKEKFKLNQKINALIDKVDVDNIKQKISQLLLEEYKDVLNVLEQNKLEEEIEQFHTKIVDDIDALGLNLRYGLPSYVSIFEEKAKHIGKSSLGWLFHFQEQEEWHSYKEFEEYVTDKEKMKDKIIVNEYHEEVSVEELLDLIDTKQNEKRNKENPKNFEYCKNVNGYRFSEGDFS